MNKECSFKIGDTVRVIDASGSPIAELGELATVLQIHLHYDGCFLVKVRAGTMVYDMFSERFELVRKCKTCTNCGQVVPPKDIIINSNIVRFNTQNIVVGCTTVSNDIVLEIAERIKENKTNE